MEVEEEVEVGGMADLTLLGPPRPPPPRPPPRWAPPPPPPRSLDVSLLGLLLVLWVLWVLWKGLVREEGCAALEARRLRGMSEG